MSLVNYKTGFSLRALKTELRRLPITVAHDLARQAAPMLTQFTRTAFESGRNVYGDARPKGSAGNDLTLVQSGATKAALRFVASGTVIRAQLGPRYARYLVGKYKILPIGDRTGMPIAWVRALNELAATMVSDPRRLAA